MLDDLSKQCTNMPACSPCMRSSEGSCRQNHASVVFGPHQSFYDFFVGRYLAQWWKRSRPEAQQFLRDHADLVDWKPSIRFALSLLAEDATE